MSYYLLFYNKTLIMRTLLTFLTTFASFYCNGQAFFKSIYHPMADYMIGVNMIPNRDSSLTAFTSNRHLKALKFDDFGNILSAKNINTTNIELDGGLLIDTISRSTLIVSGTYYDITSPIPHEYNIYLSKITNAGQPVWVKTIGSTQNREYAHKVKHTKDGGFIIVGEKWIGPVNPGRVYIVKTDSNAVIQWAEGFDRAMMDAAFDVFETENGFVIAGATDSLGTIGSFGLLIKTNKSGHIMWIKGYGAPFSFATSIIRDNNFFLLAGGLGHREYLGGVGASFDFNDNHVVLLKTDSMGNPVWAKLYQFDDGAYASKIIKTIDGGYLLEGIVGHLLSASDFSPFLLKRTA